MDKITKWENMNMKFGKYKNQKFKDILKTDEGTKYLLYIISLKNINEGLKYIVLKLIDSNLENKKKNI